MTERERLIDLLLEWGNKENDGVRAESIADYLLENGVIVPPCKIGDTVYYICPQSTIVLTKGVIYAAKVVRIVVLNIGTALDIQIYEKGVTEIPSVSDFGKTVFLTREEAEQALKEEQNHD